MFGEVMFGKENETQRESSALPGLPYIRLNRFRKYPEVKCIIDDAVQVFEHRSSRNQMVVVDKVNSPFVKEVEVHRQVIRIVTSRMPVCL